MSKGARKPSAARLEDRAADCRKPATGPRRRPAWLRARLPLLLAACALAATPSVNAPEPATPATPREFFNAGTQKLREGKLREAEAFLETALASQLERLQPPALYNLGHVRFAEGIEELKKGPAAQPTAASGRRAGQHGDEAIRDADSALAGAKS